MAVRGGRPRQVTDGRWQRSEILGRRVATIMRRRDPSDPETITEVTHQLLALAARLMRPRVLDDTQKGRLHELAVKSKPSEITRTLQSWRFRLPDRAVRRLRADTKLGEMRWQ